MTPSSHQAHEGPVVAQPSTERPVDAPLVSASRVFWLDPIVFLGIIVIGATSVSIPFGGDQGLNLLIGQVIADGGAPYRDVWDLKHPGIFFFFGAGGSLFGFDEFGVRVFELCWMLVLAFVARVMAGRWLEDRTSASLAPLLTVGLYYAVARDLHLTQTESVVGLPLLVSLWCAVEAGRAQRSSTLWLFASGVAGGVAMVFKAPYLAIPMAFWLLTARELSSHRNQHGSRPARLVALWTIAGVLVPTVSTLTYLLAKGLWSEAYWSFVTHPADAAAETPRDLERLYYAARFWIVSWSPALALAAFGLADAFRKRVGPIDAALWAWLAGGIGLVLMQVISWWEYHFFLVFVPAGLLAARGVQAVSRVRISSELGGFSRRCAAVAAALLLLFTPQIIPAVRSMAEFWTSRPLPLSREGVAAYHARRYPTYASIRVRTAFLREPDSHPGAIYVFDLPVYYLYARRPPAIPWIAPWFHPTDRPWKRLLADLDGARPAYVRVSDTGLEGIVGHRPSLRNDVERIVPFVEERYRVLSRDDGGTWYIRRDLPDAR